MAALGLGLANLVAVRGFPSASPQPAVPTVKPMLASLANRTRPMTPTVIGTSERLRVPEIGHAGRSLNERPTVGPR